MAFVPVMMTWLGSTAGMATIAAVSTAVAATSAVSQRNTQKNIAAANAEARERSAIVEQQQSGERQNALRRRVALAMGSQNAAIAESGMGFGGSASDIMQQSAINAELDVLTTRYEGDLRARGFSSQASAELFAGRRAAATGRAEAVGSVLSGVASYAGAQNQRRSLAAPTQTQINGIY